MNRIDGHVANYISNHICDKLRTLTKAELALKKIKISKDDILVIMNESHRSINSIKEHMKKGLEG